VTWLTDLLMEAKCNPQENLLAHVLSRSGPAIQSGAAGTLGAFLADILTEEIENQTFWIEASQAAETSAGNNQIEIVQRVHSGKGLPLFRIWTLNRIGDRPPQFQVADIRFVETGQSALNLFKVSVPGSAPRKPARRLRPPGFLWWMILVLFLLILLQAKPTSRGKPYKIRGRPGFGVIIGLPAFLLLLALILPWWIGEDPGTDKDEHDSIRQALEAIRDQRPDDALATLDELEPTSGLPETAVFRVTALMQMGLPGKAAEAARLIPITSVRLYQQARAALNSAPLAAADALAQLAAEFHQDPALRLAAARIFLSEKQESAAVDLLKQRQPEAGDPIAAAWCEQVLQLPGISPEEEMSTRTRLEMEHEFQALIEGSERPAGANIAHSETVARHPAGLAMRIIRDQALPALPENIHPLIHYQLLQLALDQCDMGELAKDPSFRTMLQRHPMGWALLEPVIPLLRKIELAEFAEETVSPISDVLEALADARGETESPSGAAGFVLANFSRQPAPWIPDALIQPGIQSLLFHRLPLTAADTVARIIDDFNDRPTLREMAEMLSGAMAVQQWPVFRSPRISESLERAALNAGQLVAETPFQETVPCINLVSATEIIETQDHVAIRYLWVVRANTARGAMLAGEWSMPTPRAPGIGQWEKASYLTPARDIEFERVVQVTGGAYGPDTCSVLLPPIELGRPFMISWVTILPKPSGSLKEQPYLESGFWPHPERWPTEKHLLIRQNRLDSGLQHFAVLPLSSSPDPTMIPIGDEDSVESLEPHPRAIWMVGPDLSPQRFPEVYIEALNSLIQEWKGEADIRWQTMSKEIESGADRDNSEILLRFLEKATTLERPHPMTPPCPLPRPWTQVATALGISPLERLLLLQSILEARGIQANLWMRTIRTSTSGTSLNAEGKGVFLPDPEGSLPFLLEVQEWEPGWVTPLLNRIDRPPAEGSGRTWIQIAKTRSGVGT
jgi:hypothetical protein